jgi:hypothetical protein
MLALPTHMGHAKISYTYWFLTAVPELMALAAGKFERFAQAQEVDHARRKAQNRRLRSPRWFRTSSPTTSSTSER